MPGGEKRPPEISSSAYRVRPEDAEDRFDEGVDFLIENPGEPTMAAKLVADKEAEAAIAKLRQRVKESDDATLPPRPKLNNPHSTSSAEALAILHERRAREEAIRAKRDKRAQNIPGRMLNFFEDIKNRLSKKK